MHEIFHRKFATSQTTKGEAMENLQVYVYVHSGIKKPEKSPFSLTQLYACVFSVHIAKSG